MSIDNVLKKSSGHANNESPMKDTLREFEESELEYFLDTEYNYREICDIFGEMTEPQYNLVRQATKQGTQTGIREFLAINPPALSIYCSNLRVIFDDSSMEKNIFSLLKKLNPLGYSGEEINNYYEYSNVASQTFCTFLYNESYDRFRAKFPELGNCSFMNR